MGCTTHEKQYQKDTVYSWIKVSNFPSLCGKNAPLTARLVIRYIP